MKLFSRSSKGHHHPTMPILPSPRREALLQRLAEWRGVLIAAPVMAGLVIALRLTGALQILEWAALDQFFRLRPPEPRDHRIVIVGINEADIQTLGKWSPSDRELARLLTKIKQQQPTAIGLDIFRSLPVAPGQQELNQLFATTPNLIGIEFLPTATEPAIAPPPVLQKREQVGFVNVVVDADERLRRAMLYAEVDGVPRDSLGLKLATLYLEKQGITFADNPTDLQLGQAIFPRFHPNDGGYVRAEANSYQTLLNFRGPARHFTTVSMVDVLENRIPSDLMRNRIVLIGATAPSLKDFFSTPYSSLPLSLGNFQPGRTPEQMAGVEVHAQIASHIVSAALDGRMVIQVWDESLEWLWIFLWSSVGAVLCWQLRSRVWTPIVVVAIGIGLTGGSFLAFLMGWWVPLLPPLIALLSSSAVMTAYVARREQADRCAVMNLFERHVTHEIAEEIWRNHKQFLEKGRLPGRRLVATVLFTDIKNFTPIAEQCDPETLMSWLNEYLEAMAQIVMAHGGVVDKFIGDSVMAVFGVPIPHTKPEEIASDARRAVQAARAMAIRLNHLNQKWQNEGLPVIFMRVGISTGAVVTGSLGGFQKLDYTAIGDTVNVAARLESYDKTFAKTQKTGNCRILVSEFTYEHIESLFPTQFVAQEQLRGREQVTGIYQVLL